MLIYTSRYPGFGKIKPKQYGRASFVQSSIAQNANDLLGVAAPLVAMPFWANAGGPVSYGQMLDLMSTVNTAWVPGRGLETSISAGSGKFTST